MFPFASLLSGNFIDSSLALLGTDAPVTITGTKGGSSFGCAYAGLIFQTDGDLLKRQGGSADTPSAGADVWIHSDVKPITNADDYEVRIVIISGPTGSALQGSHTTTVWHTINAQISWWITSCGDRTDDTTNTVDVEVSIRKIADPFNTEITGELTFTAHWTGE